LSRLEYENEYENENEKEAGSIPIAIPIPIPIAMRRWDVGESLLSEPFFPYFALHEQPRSWRTTMRHFLLLACLLTFLSCGEQKPPARELLTKGELYYKERKLVEAMDQFQQFVEYYPDSSQAARCAFMIGFIHANDFQDTLRAREAYQKFLADFLDADPGLRTSAEWELKHLGQDISDLDFLSPEPTPLEPVAPETPQP